MRKLGIRAFAVGLALAVGAPLVATTADAAVVICQKKNKLKLRVDACASKETQVDASELGVTGPAGAQGPVGPEGPSNLLAAVRVNADGTLGSAHTAAGITATSSLAGVTYSVTLAGTGLFTGLEASDFILNVTAESTQWAVANAIVSSGTLTADGVIIDIYPWVSSVTGGGGDLSDNAVFLTVYKGD